MKRFYRISVAAILVLFLLAGSPDIYHNLKDRLAWADMKSMLKGKRILSVDVSGLRSANIVLNPSDQEKILDSLQKAKFQASNWRKHGPTPETAVILKFADGTRESFSYWGGSTFETTYKDSQFLISAFNLDTYVKNKALIKAGSGVSAVGIYQLSNGKGNLHRAALP